MRKAVTRDGGAAWRKRRPDSRAATIMNGRDPLLSLPPVAPVDPACHVVSSSSANVGRVEGILDTGKIKTQKQSQRRSENRKGALAEVSRGSTANPFSSLLFGWPTFYFQIIFHD